MSTPCLQLYVSVREKTILYHLLHLDSWFWNGFVVVFIQKGESVHLQDLFTDLLDEEYVVVDCER